MVEAILEQKLESLRRCVSRLQQKCPATAEQLGVDIDAQDIVSLNLTRAIQLCVDVGAHWLAEDLSAASPQSMGETFELLAAAHKLDAELALRLKMSVGFRNIMMHNYETINWAIVFSLCQHRLEDFRSFARAFS